MSVKNQASYNCKDNCAGLAVEPGKRTVREEVLICPLQNLDWVSVTLQRCGIVLMREGKVGGGSRAWQLARLALEDHGEGKFDNGGIFSGVPRGSIYRPTPSLIPMVHTMMHGVTQRY